jgi:glycosyltransferase involved in cell wall biosynthesis
MPWRLVTVGSLDQAYKGVDTILSAVARVRGAGLSVKLNVIGDGKHRLRLEEYCRDLGIDDAVRFVGRVQSPREVARYLDESDMFLLASRTEGLPRAMLEAMARGLPCLGTKVGGIPEVLAENDLFRVSQADDLAEKMRAALNDPQIMNEMARRNWMRAQDYREEALRSRRCKFYSCVESLTREWFDRRHDPQASQGESP